MAVFKMIDKRKRAAGFDQVPNDIMRGMGELSDSAYRVYMYIHSLGKDFSPTQRGLAKALGKTEATIQRAYSELIEYGYLDLVRSGKRYVYFVRENPKDKRKLLGSS